jgi:hypothetical protein
MRVADQFFYTFGNNSNGQTGHTTDIEEVLLPT